MSLTPVINFYFRISPRIFIKIQNGPHSIIIPRGRGNWFMNKTWSRKSRGRLPLMFLLVPKGGGAVWVSSVITLRHKLIKIQTTHATFFSLLMEQFRHVQLFVHSAVYLYRNYIRKSRCFQMLNGTRGSHTRTYSIMPFDEIFIWIVHSCICTVHSFLHSYMQRKLSSFIQIRFW